MDVHFNYLCKVVLFFNKIYCSALQGNVEMRIYEIVFLT